MTAGPPSLRCRAPIETVGVGRRGPTIRREFAGAAGWTSLVSSGGLHLATARAFQLPPLQQHLRSPQKLERALKCHVGPLACHAEGRPCPDQRGLMRATLLYAARPTQSSWCDRGGINGRGASLEAF